jgi:HEAT repeats
MLKRFTEGLEAHLSTGRFDDLFAVQQEFLDLVFDSSFVTEMLNAALSKIARLSPRDPENWDADTIVLARGEHWEIAYGAPDSNADFLYSNPCFGICAVVGREPLVVRRYSASARIDTDVFDPDVTLKLRREEEFKRESFFSIDARTDVDEFVDSSGARVVTLIGPPNGAIRWAFCRKNLHAVQPIATHPADATIVTYIRALVAMNATEAVSTLTTLTEHSSHFVRWTALQALIRLNPDSAGSGLQRALNDPHPHIQRASEKAIAQLSA